MAGCRSGRECCRTVICRRSIIPTRFADVIPLYDENPTIRTPVMTMFILALTWAVWLTVQGGLDMQNPLALAASVCNYGMVPGELTKLAPLGYELPIGPGVA